jgi:DNA polymerase elongation subunit (family B)
MLNVEEMIEKLNQHLTKEFNINKSTINIKLDKHFTRLLYIAKKNYAGLIDGKLHAKGLDYLKTSTLPYAAKLQKELIESILVKNQLSFEKTFAKLRDDFYNTVFDESNIDLITLKQRVTKHPSKYTTQNAPAMIAQWMIDNKMNFYPGLFVSLVCTGYVDGKIQGCHPDSNLWQGKIDKNYIWSNQILPKLSRIVEVVSPQFDWKQYDPQIVEQRNKKISQYEKWLLDSKKNEHVIQKINDDPVLSEKQKQDLIKFGMQSRAKSLW